MPPIRFPAARPRWPWPAGRDRDRDLGQGAGDREQDHAAKRGPQPEAVVELVVVLERPIPAIQVTPTANRKTATTIGVEKPATRAREYADRRPL